MSENNYPLNQKLCLTVEEASTYSGIPVGMLRQMAHEDSCSFTFCKPKQGQKLLIKREALEDFVRNSVVS